MNSHSPTRRAFTLLELVAALVVLLLLAGISVPRFHDYAAASRENACRDALEGMRAEINHFHMHASTQGTARWPTLTELKTVGTVLHERIPRNPYLSNSSINAVVVAGTWPGVGAPPVESTQTGGWRYDEKTGRIWANSATIPESAPGGSENTW